MARARNIKPSFFMNEELVELDPIDRLLFIGLWCLADREGRIENRPKRIKMELFPCDSYDVAKGISNLAKYGFVSVYTADGKDVISVSNFLKHQSPHGTEKDSTLPDDNGKYTVHARTKNGCVTVDKQCENDGLTNDNATLTLDNVNQPLVNALNPDSRILNPDSRILNPDSRILNKETKAQRAPRFDAQAHLSGLGVDHQVIADWLTLRKQNRSTVTETAIEGIEREALKAGMSLEAALRECCSRGWKGFKAEWMQNAQQPTGQPAYRTVGQERADTIAALTGRSPSLPSAPALNVIEGGCRHVAG